MNINVNEKRFDNDTKGVAPFILLLLNWIDKMNRITLFFILFYTISVPDVKTSGIMKFCYRMILATRYRTLLCTSRSAYRIHYLSRSRYKR